ncbi:MAG: pyridoxal-phosphate dependent enzyme [Anaerolineales bacterium]|nr:pyridoxal-phosphate dependent enzyme [Anaerolineales bacterium]
MYSHLVAECLDCGHQASYSPKDSTCPNCGGGWREARYDYKSIGEKLLKELPARPFDIWRFHDLLPISEHQPIISMGEGGTPLLKATNLGSMLGIPYLYIKDERQNPTGSFKDRQASITVASLKEAGITETVLASTGNVAISYSAYTSRAGIKLWAFLTSLVPSEKMREVAIYGTQVIKVTASYDQTKKLAAEFAEQRQQGSYLDRGVRSIPALESMKTMAFEISEQLTAALGPPDSDTDLSQVPWRVPDWYIQAVSGGMGPVGVLKGFEELREMDLTDRIPAAASIQPAGCAPMVHAWKQNLDVAEPVLSPRTHIATLATGDPGRTYTLLRERMLRGGGGTFESVTDEEAFRAIHVLAKMEGLSMEPASAVAFAGLIKMVRSGQIKPDEVVVVNMTGHTMPVEKTILGEGWVQDIEIPEKPPEEKPEEGLLSALSRITPKRYSSVAIVDDHPHARRLIRRILQSQGEYTIFEASNGREAVELAQKEELDVMVLDLMMPEMDGFSVLDALKTDEKTASIAVIVVTAKTLTSAEKARLRGRIHSLMQKGEFLDDELVEEIDSLLQNESN